MFQRTKQLGISSRAQVQAAARSLADRGLMRLDISERLPRLFFRRPYRQSCANVARKPAATASAIGNNTGDLSRIGAMARSLPFIGSSSVVTTACPPRTM
jgi:hypothetical protein